MELTQSKGISVIESTGYIAALNRAVLDQVKGITYTVADNAPDTASALFGHIGELVVWSGASDQTIYGSESVNWAFRAWHDSIHLDYGLGFSVGEEIEIAEIQAGMIGGRLGDILYAEVAGQAEYLLQNGEFPKDQKAFINEYLGNLWGESVNI